MYEAVASSRSAAPVARSSIASELWRPVVRTEEAAAWSASPVSSRASSSLLPADRTNSSIDSLASLPSSDAGSVAVFKVVKMFLQSLGWSACASSNREKQGTFVSIAIERRKGRPTGRRPAEAAKIARSQAMSALGRVRLLPPRLSRAESARVESARWQKACSVITCRERPEKVRRADPPTPPRRKR